MGRGVEAEWTERWSESAWANLPSLAAACCHHPPTPYHHPHQRAGCYHGSHHDYTCSNGEETLCLGTYCDASGSYCEQPQPKGPCDGKRDGEHAAARAVHAVVCTSRSWRPLATPCTALACSSNKPPRLLNTGAQYGPNTGTTHPITTPITTPYVVQVASTAVITTIPASTAGRRTAPAPTAPRTAAGARTHTALLAMGSATVSKRWWD